jgi:hypothetical protein
LILCKRRKELDDEEMQRKSTTKDEIESIENVLKIDVIENPKSKGQMDKYLMIVKHIVSEEVPIEDDSGKEESDEVEIKAIRRIGEYKKVEKKEEPAPWWKKNMTDEEVKQKRQDIKQRTVFGKNVPPPKKEEDEEYSYYSSSDEDDDKRSSEGDFSPPKPGEKVNATKDLGAPKSSQTTGVKITPARRLLEVSRPGSDRKSDRPRIPVKKDDLVKKRAIHPIRVSEETKEIYPIPGSEAFAWMHFREIPETIEN